MDSPIYYDNRDRMYREMEARLLDPPTFEATSSSVAVTLRNRSLADVDDQAWLLGFADDVTPGERRALIVARRDGAVTRRALRPLMAESEVSAVLERAVAKGIAAARWIGRRHPLHARREGSRRCWRCRES